MPRNSVRIALICLGVGLLCILPESGAAAKGFPFRQGEKMIYQATWGIVPAGGSVIEVLPDETVNGVRAWHFAMTTTTNAGIDVFYKVRERKESFMDPTLQHTLLYKEKEEGNHPRDVVVT